MADYYRDASNGAFTPHFDVVGPVRLSRPASYYGGDRNYYEDGLLYADVDTCVADMVVEACKLADSLVDFRNTMKTMTARWIIFISSMPDLAKLTVIWLM